MCGIAGILSAEPLSGISGYISEMTDKLRHRGPDDEGFFLYDNNRMITCGGSDTTDAVWNSEFPYSPSARIGSISEGYSLAFGFRRLSIIDLSPAGHQPLCSEDQKYWIVFNGEIYNYLELREELKSKGHQFKSASDTEVIIAAYREWGTNCLQHFNGMWAFVIFDSIENKLFGARDRFGVKPLYYFSDKKTFAFASEQKALVKMPFVKTGINKKAVFDYFARGEMEKEEISFFENIFELMPAHAFELDIKTRSFRKYPYYSLSYNSNFTLFENKEKEKVKSELRELIFNAVEKRMRADVPVGSCLSGGLDSSSIVCIVNQFLKENNFKNIGERQKVFTACFDDPRIDESRWAAKVVEHTHAEWHRTYPKANELLKDLETLIYCQDVPIWASSTYAQYRVMQLASENGIKVVLDGQGADELFAGYSHYNMAYLIELLRNKQWKLFNSEFSKTGKFPQNAISFLKNILKYNILPSLSADITAIISRHYFEGCEYLSKNIWNDYAHQFEQENFHSFNSLNQMLHFEFNNSFLKGYLRCEDRCSMHFSIESRTPFADDHKLIEYVFNLPSSYKINEGTNKFIFRESMQNILPEEVRTRTDKLGYATPHNSWIGEIKEELKPYFTSDLEEFIDVKKIHKNYEKLFGTDGEKEKHQIFKFISFAVWKKTFGL